MVSSFPNTLLRIVFASYVSRSLKVAERDRRTDRDVVELAKIDCRTKVTAQMEKFWGSFLNKVKLQEFFAETALDIAKETDIKIVLSIVVLGTEMQPCRAIINRQEFGDIAPLKSSLEEADSGIIPHIN